MFHCELQCINQVTQDMREKSNFSPSLWSNKRSGKRWKTDRLWLEPVCWRQFRRRWWPGSADSQPSGPPRCMRRRQTPGTVAIRWWAVPGVSARRRPGDRCPPRSTPPLELAVQQPCMAASYPPCWRRQLCWRRRWWRSVRLSHQSEVVVEGPWIAFLLHQTLNTTHKFYKKNCTSNLIKFTQCLLGLLTCWHWWQLLQNNFYLTIHCHQ